MTDRGGGNPTLHMVFEPRFRMGPLPWSFAADAHDCIMVSILTDRPNTSLWRDLAPDGELTSDRLVVLLLVDCKPSRSNQRSMTLKSGLTENAPYKCNICFAKLLSRFVSVTRGGYDAGVKSRREKLSQQADQERQRARDWLVRFMQDNQPKFYTKEELRVVAIRDLKVSKLSFDMGWIMAIEDTGRHDWYEPLRRRPRVTRC